MMSNESKEVKAVHIADLENLLKRYGQLDDFKNNAIKCQICQEIVSTDNVGSVKLKDNKLQFTCNKRSCYNEIIKNT